MAIIDQGEILLEAEPLRAVEDTQGRIWRRVISSDALSALEREHAVISGDRKARSIHDCGKPR